MPAPCRLLSAAAKQCTDLARRAKQLQARQINGDQFPAMTFQISAVQAASLGLISAT